MVCPPKIQTLFHIPGRARSAPTEEKIEINPSYIRRGRPWSALKRSAGFHSGTEGRARSAPTFLLPMLNHLQSESYSSTRVNRDEFFDSGFEWRR